VHAQDRLWQMDFRRRVGSGRLAEVLGPAALPTDRFMRTLGLARAASASLAHLRPDTVVLLEAYAAGVNAYLATRSGPLPLEFLILGYQPEPWTAVDSLVWMRVLALNLSGNWRDELLRARLARRLSPEQIADLWPADEADTPITLAASAPARPASRSDAAPFRAAAAAVDDAVLQLARRLPADALAAALPTAPPSGMGSNAWVLAGSRTASGAPLLANDPHLGLSAPGPWYLAHLAAPERELIGASMPGLPGVVLGHNGVIAWGFTNTGPDTQDLFVERLDPADPARYLTPEGSAPFATRDEVIRVKGGEAVSLRVRETRHGPVLSDLLPTAGLVLERDQVLTLRWTALAEDDVSIEALLDLGAARDWPTFVAAARGNGAPQQNVLYADTAGHIGFIAPGRVPIRARGDGRWPVPGWTGEFDWQGTIPFAQLPRALDPPDGAFVNANNRIVTGDYPYLLTADWEPPFRARRIVEALAERGNDLDSFARLQADELSLLVRDLLPLMLEAPAQSEAAAAARARLAAWDAVMRPDAAEPLIFAAWYRELSRKIYADELGDLFYAYWGVRPQFMEFVLRRRQLWCDDVDTAAVETCAMQATTALELALADLKRRFGADPAGWRWGAAHPARMQHAVFKDQPLLGWLFAIEHPSGGDNVTVNVGHYRPADEVDPFASVHAASYRALYDLADLEGSRFVASTGQSGNPLSPHYRDLSDLWADGRTIPMSTRPETYGPGAIGRLTLTPAAPR
ncbi:MAG TPA: penicillin acylase family protein, partial [Geminicoccaceae bacterium]|nr:penicillin acylase family protein [Geminicoccaceae bacterium]